MSQEESSNEHRMRLYRTARRHWSQLTPELFSAVYEAAIISIENRVTGSDDFERLVLSRIKDMFE